MTADDEGLDGVSFGCWLFEVLETESRKILSVGLKRRSFLLNEMTTLPEMMPCKNSLVSQSENDNRSLLGMPLRDPAL